MKPNKETIMTQASGRSEFREAAALLREHADQMPCPSGSDCEHLSEWECAALFLLLDPTVDRLKRGELLGGNADR